MNNYRRGRGRYTTPPAGIRETFLLDKARPVKTSAILDHLIEVGIEVAGEVPVNNLSAMLSNDPRFRPNGRAGWTLRPQEEVA